MPRTDAPHRYANRGGKQGKERLDVLARALLPTTTQLFDRAGLIKGMKCLDVGCGGGHVAMLIAGIVGPEGLVIATDKDPEILALAREDAEAAKITNVKFQQLDACTCLWHNKFYLMLVFCSRTCTSPQTVSQPWWRRVRQEELSSSRTLILRGAFVIQLVRPTSGTRSCIKNWYN